MSGCGECAGCPAGKESGIKDADYTIALAGNANVGKSVIFNQLTGVDQIIGNWPGKTVERAEGLLLHKGKRIRVIDLPGIYSFSTYSMEELVSRDFIALEHPDAVINVIDASALERNLFFTIQLTGTGAPADDRGQPGRPCGKEGDHDRYGETLRTARRPGRPDGCHQGQGDPGPHRRDHGPHAGPPGPPAPLATGRKWKSGS